MTEPSDPKKTSDPIGTIAELVFGHGAARAAVSGRGRPRLRNAGRPTIGAHGSLEGYRGRSVLVLHQLRKPKGSGARRQSPRGASLLLAGTRAPSANRGKGRATPCHRVRPLLRVTSPREPTERHRIAPEPRHRPRRARSRTSPIGKRGGGPGSRPTRALGWLSIDRGPLRVLDQPSESISRAARVRAHRRWMALRGDRALITRPDPRRCSPTRS